MLGVGRAAIFELPRYQDARGVLVAAEFSRHVPFQVKRYFSVYDVPNKEVRGEHAHRNCEQFLVCIKGSCAVLIDDGRNRTEILLNSPNKGLYIPSMVWGEQFEYSADAFLLVFASEFYDDQDYIRDYSEFIALVGDKKLIP